MVVRVFAGVILWAASLASVRCGLAWGPHEEIGRAAIRVLPDAALHRYLIGPEFDRLAPYGFLADWRGELREGFVVDDYLLFPGFPRHSQHIMPDVPRTYRPYFLRALRAMRTESPANAVRWAGALMHFQQDSGSPPHALGILGPLHTKMENWVDASAIDITGYKPRLLGYTEEEAADGFERRMRGLVAYSRERGEALTPILEGLDERVDQPLALECANETARVTADLLHTLLSLRGDAPSWDSGTLRGTVRFDSSVPGQGAKIVFTGTDLSTVTDPEGRFTLRGVPRGDHEVRVMAFGCETAFADVTTGRGVTTLDPALAPDAVPGNRFRDPSLSTFWVRDDRPDGWSEGRLDGGPAQESPWTVLPAGATAAAVRVVFADGARPPDAVLRVRRNPREPDSGTDVPLPWRPDGDASRADAAFELPEWPGPPGVSVQLILKDARPPQDFVRHVAVVPGG